MSAATADERGRQAQQPRDIPKRGWRDILRRTLKSVGRNHVSMAASSIAFYALSSIFPAIAAMVAIWGLTFDPSRIEGQIEAISRVLPPEAASIIVDQARKVAAQTTGINLAAVLGLALALWSSAAAMKAMIEGLNMVYGEEEKRGFVRLNLYALALTLGFIVVMVFSLGMIAVVPALLAFFGWTSGVEAIVAALRWPVLFAVALFGLAALYRYAPSRDEPRWRWVSWGSVVATSLWIAGSVGFSLYVGNFGSYNETYGSLGAVIILLMWFWLSAFIVLLGAQINAEMEHQTARDTTRGPERPMGSRGAYVADTLGEEK